jgi:hypothetical protein
VIALERTETYIVRRETFQQYQSVIEPFMQRIRDIYASAGKESAAL